MKIEEPDLSGTYTYADYLTWQLGEMTELIRGKIFKMSPAPGSLHQKISGELFRQSANFLKGKKCQVFSAPFDVRLPLSNKSKSDREIITVVQPDLCVICDPAKIDERGCVGAPDNAPAIDIPGTGDLNQVTEKAGGIQQQIKDGVTTEQVTQALEDKASQVDQVKALQGQTLPSQPDGLPIEIPANSDAAKEQLMTMAKTEAINHFAGKEAVLQQAMDKMSEYKEKYNSVSSITDLPDKRPNPMKEKPFIERLVPAITLQFQSFRYFLMDVNVSAGYRFTEHIIAGLGWNQRWAYSIDDRGFNPSARIYGVRSYGEYKFKKGFALRTDVECMNTFVNQTINGTNEVGQREWV